MKDKMLKILFIVIGCIPFAWLFAFTVIDSWEYLSFANYFVDVVINIGRFPVVLAGLVLIIIGALIPSKNKETSSKTKNTKVLWIVLLVVGIIPFAAPILMAVIDLFMQLSTSNNPVEFLTYWSYVFWPTYIVGALLIALSTVKLKKCN